MQPAYKKEDRKVMNFDISLHFIPETCYSGDIRYSLGFYLDTQMILIVFWELRTLSQKNLRFPSSDLEVLSDCLKQSGCRKLKKKINRSK